MCQKSKPAHLSPHRHSPAGGFRTKFSGASNESPGSRIRPWCRTSAALSGLELQPSKIALFTAASDSFTRHNIKSTVRDSLNRFAPIIRAAERDGILVRAYISTVVFCPYEGRVTPRRVLDVMQQLFDLGVSELSLGETVGKAAPSDLRRLLDTVIAHINPARLSLHCHDTYGLGIANVLTAWEDYGITAFDCSAGGLGGCPLRRAPPATWRQKM